jgi:hypothetical protein
MQQHCRLPIPPVALLVTALVLGGSASAQPRGGNFLSIIPQNWSLASDPHSNARRFISPDGTAWLSIYATRARSNALDADIDAVRKVPDGRITYERTGQSWIVVSGFQGSRIFYRKAMLACGNRRWHHIDFSYPAVQKRAFDRLVTRVSYALAAYEDVGCRR